jgi:hypothetical protein
MKSEFRQILDFLLGSIKSVLPVGTLMIFLNFLFLIARIFTTLSTTDAMTMLTNYVLKLSSHC